MENIPKEPMSYKHYKQENELVTKLRDQSTKPHSHPRTATNNWETPIRIGQDNGVEFCSGSPRKADDWNRMLTPLNASIYTYNPYWDIRQAGLMGGA